MFYIIICLIVYNKLCLCLTLFCVWLVNGFAALVPLEELRELNFTKQYGIARDPEVIGILDTASKTKGVFMLFFLITVFYFLLQLPWEEIKYGVSVINMNMFNLCVFMLVFWNRQRQWQRCTGEIQGRSCVMLWKIFTWTLWLLEAGV